MTTKLKKLAGNAVLAGLLFAAASAAQAVDLRSWDLKINDGAKRFVVLAAFDNEAVLDKETQLVWQRTPEINASSWPAANAYCDMLSIGGRYGWRLPTINELMSLMVAQSGGVGRLPSGHPFIGVTAKYWSSSMYPTAINQVAILDPMRPSGSPYSTDTFGAFGIRAWCVRGPSASHPSSRL